MIKIRKGEGLHVGDLGPQDSALVVVEMGFLGLRRNGIWTQFNWCEGTTLFRCSWNSRRMPKKERISSHRADSSVVRLGGTAHCRRTRISISARPDSRVTSEAQVSTAKPGRQSTGNGSLTSLERQGGEQSGCTDYGLVFNSLWGCHIYGPLGN